MSEGLPSYRVDGPVAIIQLNRPSVHNRMEPEDLMEIRTLLDRADADPALRVVVLTGTGKSFSSGFNIGKIEGGKGDEGGDGSFDKAVDRLERFRLPTICALNGGVYGGSTDMALACDFRIGAEGLAMFMPAARLGLHYYSGGMRRYVSRLGLNAAKRLFLTAEKLEAAELLRIGYLTEVVPANRLMSRAMELAGVLAANAPLAVQGMKECLNGIARGDADPARIAELVARSRGSEDLLEGRTAWLEKRVPRFKGA